MDSRSSLPPSIWMYLSGLVVALCGLYVARLVVEDKNFVNLVTTLTLMGFLFSYIARRLGWFEQSSGLLVRWLFAGLIVYALFSFWTQGGILPFDVESTYGGTAITFLCWLVVFSSFMLASDEHVLFLAVPVVALLGVAAPAISSVQSFWLFSLFLGNAAFLLAHENTRRLYSRATGGTFSLRKQLLVATTCGVAAALVGIVISFPLRDTTLRLSGAPMLPNAAIPTSNSGVSASFAQTAIPVGSGPVSLSEQAVLQVQSSEPLYWRGSVFVRYTGRGWANPRFGFFTRELFNVDMPFQDMPERRNGLYTLPVPPVSPEPVRYREVVQRYKLLYGASNIVYGAHQPVEVRFPNLAVQVDGTGCLQSLYGYRSGTEYEVVSRVPEFTPEELRKAPPATPADVGWVYFDLPNPPNPRLQELAERLTADLDNNYDKVMAIKAYIESTCRYNLNAPPVPMGRDAVEFFLFDSKEGYCDLFSSALAVLARYAGIPSRVATGFLPGDPQPDGTFVAKEKHRHQWTEIYFPGYGWLLFDPTEGARDVTESDTPNEQMRRLWQRLTQRYGLLPMLLIFGAISLLAFAVWNELSSRVPRRYAPSQMVRRYLRATAMLGKAGVVRQSWMTPSEYAEQVQKVFPQAGDAMWALTRLLERSEYGRGVTAEEIAEADRQLHALRTALKRRYRWHLR